MKSLPVKKPVTVGCNSCDRYIDLRQRDIWYQRCTQRKMSECEMVRRYAILAKRDMAQASATPRSSPRRRDPLKLSKLPDNPKGPPPNGNRIALATNFIQYVVMPCVEEAMKKTSPTAPNDEESASNSKVEDTALAGLVRNWFNTRLPEANSNADVTEFPRTSGKKRALDESSSEGDEDLSGPRKCARGDDWRKDTPLAKVKEIKVQNEKREDVKEPRRNKIGDKVKRMSNKKRGNIIPNDSCSIQEPSFRNGDIFLPSSSINQESRVLDGVRVDAQVNQELNKRGDWALNQDSPLDLDVHMGEKVHKGDCVKKLKGEGMSNLLPNRKTPGNRVENRDVVSSSKPKNGNITEGCCFFVNIDDDVDYDGCPKCKQTKEDESLKKGDENGEGTVTKDKENERKLRKDLEGRKKIDASAERKGRSIHKKSADVEVQRNNIQEVNDEDISEKETPKKRLRSKEECSKKPDNSLEYRKRKRSAASREVSKKRRGSVILECRKRERTPSSQLPTKKVAPTRENSSTEEYEERDYSHSEEDEGSTSSLSVDEDKNTNKNKNILGSTSNVEKNPHKMKKKGVTQKQCGFIEDFHGKGGKKDADGCGEGKVMKTKEVRRTKEEASRNDGRESRVERETREEKERRRRAREKIRRRQLTPIPAARPKCCVPDREIKGYCLFVSKIKQEVQKSKRKYSVQEIELFAARCWHELCKHEREAFMVDAERADSEAAAKARKPDKCKNYGGKKK